MSETTLKILMLDEKRITSDLDRAGYRKIGATIIMANNFISFSNTIATQNVDVIVINYDFKDVDALGVCEHSKRNVATAQIPIVFTSVQSVPAKVINREYGPDLVIQQPIPREYFIEKIRNLLEQRIRDTDRVDLRSQVHFKIEGSDYSCEIRDISMSGLLIGTDINLNSGLSLQLEFNLPGYKKPIKVEGEVVRQIIEKNKADGYGIKFVNFSGDSQKRLEKYVSKSHNDDPKLVYYL